MKHNKIDACSKTPRLCMQEPGLRQLVQVAGLQEMTIWRNRNSAWHLSVTVTQRSQVLYLSTRLEAALAAGQRLRATRQVTLGLR